MECPKCRHEWDIQPYEWMMLSSERVNEHGEVVSSGGFVKDEERGKLFGVWNGKELKPFFTLRQAQQYADRLKKPSKYECPDYAIEEQPSQVSLRC